MGQVPVPVSVQCEQYTIFVRKEKTPTWTESANLFRDKVSLLKNQDKAVKLFTTSSALGSVHI